MFRAAKQTKVFQDVVTQIQEAILDGRLKTGDTLPSERQLKDTFNISRGTLREALRVLEQMGLIEIKLGVGGGSVVKDLNADQVSESLALLIRSQKVSLNHLAEFREDVEGIVAARAAAGSSAADIDKLNELLDKARKCIDAGPSQRDAFIEIDRSIHMTLARLTANPIYISVLHSVHDNIHRYYDEFLSMDEPELRENYQDLCDLVKAVEKGQAEHARRLARDHVRRFNRYMKRREQSEKKVTKKLKSKAHPMILKRITKHPILEIPEKKEVIFTWNKKKLTGYEGEMISSALFANSIYIFGHHPKDNSPQGIFCANGQCSQCLVIADGLPVKSCMTPLSEGMVVSSVEGLPQLPADDAVPRIPSVAIKEVDVLIIGAGPAGLAAAVELGKLGVETLIIDDKDRPGGKLVLQTHKFFGSVEDSYAGTRGFEIAAILQEEINKLESVEIWLNTTAVGVFSDKIVGAVQNVKSSRYKQIKPKKLLITTGAREKMLSFPGNTLPGVYGAGAFQTLVNRDLIKSSDKVFIVGGGNVGLIAGYHAIQAGIEVVALIEALPQVSGYKVHADKLKRLGVPIFTGHTVVAAGGKEKVETVTIARLDQNWKVVPDTHKTFEVDTILIAVGLAEVNEFYLKAKKWKMDVFCAGDAQEIAEASAAMFTGKIEGLKIAQSLGLPVREIPEEWDRKAIILKSKPGPAVSRKQPTREQGVFPIFHCYQEVPCNPCASVCPVDAIRTEHDEITGLPYITDLDACTGCASCVAVCPGLSMVLVDYREDPEHPLVTLPYEIWRERVEVGQKVPITDVDGAILGYYPVEKISTRRKYPGTLLVRIKVDKKVAKAVMGIWVQEKQTEPSQIYEKELPPDDAIICRCERITAGEIKAAIHKGVRDINQLKALTRTGMGACGSKTCRPMIWRIFQEEGIDLKTVTDRVDRPLFVEVPLGILAGKRKGGRRANE